MVNLEGANVGVANGGGGEANFSWGGHGGPVGGGHAPPAPLYKSLHYFTT